MYRQNHSLPHSPSDPGAVVATSHLDKEDTLPGSERLIDRRRRALKSLASMVSITSAEVVGRQCRRKRKWIFERAANIIKGEMYHLCIGLIRDHFPLQSLLHCRHLLEKSSKVRALVARPQMACDDHAGGCCGPWGNTGRIL